MSTPTDGRETTRFNGFHSKWATSVETDFHDRSRLMYHMIHAEFIKAYFNASHQMNDSMIRCSMVFQMKNHFRCSTSLSLSLSLSLSSILIIVSMISRHRNSSPIAENNPVYIDVILYDEPYSYLC